MYEGSTVFMYCTSKATPYWTNDKIEQNIETTSNLILEDVSLEDSDNYYCHGTYYNNDTFSVASTLLVAS